MSTTNQHPEGWGTNFFATSPPSMSEREFEVWAASNDRVRAEWAQGEVKMMSPVSFDHADLNLWLGRVFAGFVEARRLGVVVGPEYMVRLGGGKSRRVPDLIFVAEQRRSLIQVTFLDGSPDLAVEIVSADSPSRDYREKYLEYEAAGVKEFWIVDPFTQRIEAYRLGEDGQFAPIDAADGKVASTVLDGYYLRNEWLWATPRPTAMNVLKEMGIA